MTGTILLRIEIIYGKITEAELRIWTMNILGAQRVTMNDRIAAGSI